MSNHQGHYWKMWVCMLCKAYWSKTDELYHIKHSRFTDFFQHTQELNTFCWFGWCSSSLFGFFFVLFCKQWWSMINSTPKGPLPECKYGIGSGGWACCGLAWANATYIIQNDCSQSWMWWLQLTCSINTF